jgi:hypothetical protein
MERRGWACGLVTKRWRDEARSPFPENHQICRWGSSLLFTHRICFYYVEYKITDNLA